MVYKNAYWRKCEYEIQDLTILLTLSGEHKWSWVTWYLKLTPLGVWDDTVRVLAPVPQRPAKGLCCFVLLVLFYRCNLVRSAQSAECSGKNCPLTWAMECILNKNGSRKFTLAGALGWRRQLWPLRVDQAGSGHHCQERTLHETVSVSRDISSDSEQWCDVLSGTLRRDGHNLGQW